MVNITDRLVDTTVLIETDDGEGKSWVGTGFFFDFAVKEASHLPAIITNKHVIEDAISAKMRFTCVNPSGERCYFDYLVQEFEDVWTLHASDDVDLAAMPLSHMRSVVSEKGWSTAYRSFSAKHIPTPQELAELSAVEDILMIGYPQGFWDHVNNRPIVRRGITASPVYENFQGLPHFMIDCAIFGGSSGSPIVLHTPGSYIDKSGAVVAEGRSAKLLGVLYSGPDSLEPSERLDGDQAQGNEPTYYTKVGMNLGRCVRSTEIAWFEDHFQKLVAQGR